MTLIAQRVRASKQYHSAWRKWLDTQQKYWFEIAEIFWELVNKLDYEIDD